MSPVGKVNRIVYYGINVHFFNWFVVSETLRADIERCIINEIPYGLPSAMHKSVHEICTFLSWKKCAFLSCNL